MTMEMVDFSKYCNIPRGELLGLVAAKMSQKRFEHCLRVEQTAIELARLHHVSPAKAALAAVVHDYAKELPLPVMQHAVKEFHFPKIYENQNGKVLHGPLAAKLIELELGITDKEVQKAVWEHTIGDTDMSGVSKVLFIADYIEPGRSFPGVEVVRTLARVDLDSAVRYKITHTLNKLIEKGVYVFPYTLEVYNQVVAKRS